VVSIMPYGELAVSVAPFADVALRAQGPQLATVLSVIALVSTANTVLIILIATSRLTYGMAKDGTLPKFLSRIHFAKRTPWIAIVLIMVFSAVFSLAGDIELIANVTNFVTFIVFLTVNLALINLYRKNAVKAKKYSKALSIRRVPILAVLGASLSIAMLFQFNPLVIVIAILLLFFGAPVYYLLKNTPQNERGVQQPSAHKKQLE
jgi:APA family basic amino acid/polyamine antiporter